MRNRIYDLETLRKAYNRGDHLKYLFFWGHTPPADGRINESCFSQWWMCRFAVDGTEYTCAEQFMMAEKARMFGDGEMLSMILKAKHPKEMKAYGRAVRNFDKDKWDGACYEIVKRGESGEVFPESGVVGLFEDHEIANPGGSESERPDLGHRYGKK